MRAHLRIDQDAEELKKYWSAELNIPLVNIFGAIIDQRIVELQTYST